MKRYLTSLVFLVFAAALTAQTPESYGYFKIGGVELGGYIGMNTKYTEVCDNSAGMLDFKGAVTFESGWAVGLNFSGLWYDRALDEIVTDGSYHLSSGYGGIFVEKMFNVTDDFKLSLSLLFGQGNIEYIYDKQYRDDKVWYEETIDKTTYHLTEPGIEFSYRIASNWWIGVNGSYRMASPVKMIGTDEDVMRNFSSGITVRYGIF